MTDSKCGLDACHSEVKIDRGTSRNRVLMSHRVDDATVAIDCNTARPLLLILLGHFVMSGAEMSKRGGPPILRDTDDMVTYGKKGPQRVAS